MKMKKFLKRILKKLLAPTIQEVLKEREEEITETTYRVVRDSRCTSP